MTRCHAASSKVHLHSSVRFSPCPVASFGSRLPWTLPLAFHPTVTSDAERDWRPPWILGWERFRSTQHKRHRVALGTHVRTNTLQKWSVLVQYNTWNRLFKKTNALEHTRSYSIS